MMRTQYRQTTLEIMKANIQENNFNDFAKCPKGHVYDTELGECPYCNGKKTDDVLKEMPEKPSVKKNILKDIADCYLIGPKDF